MRGFISKKYLSKKGFTTVEMVVVMSIIAVLLTAAIPFFSVRKQSLLRKSSQELVADIRTSYVKAISVVETSSPTESVFPKAHVIHIQKGSSSYDILEYKKNGSDLALLYSKTINFDPGIKVNEILSLGDISGNTTLPNDIYIIYTTPYGWTYTTKDNPTTSGIWTEDEVSNSYVLNDAQNLGQDSSKVIVYLGDGTSTAPILIETNSPDVYVESLL